MRWFVYALFPIHQVQVRGSHSRLGLLAAATAGFFRRRVLPASAAAWSPPVASSASTPLACQALPDQVVDRPDRVAVTLSTAEADELRYLLVGTRWRIQVEREDGQAMAAERQLHLPPKPQRDSSLFTHPMQVINRAQTPADLSVPTLDHYVAA